MGCVPPEEGYLEGLREITARYGTVLIFDEVMTGFRLARGGAQERFGVTPDLTCLGKIIGGGLPVGAYGGRREIMDQLAPSGPVYQAGTLSGNPLAMVAGLATLRAAGQPGFYDRLEELGERWRKGMVEAASAGEPALHRKPGRLDGEPVLPGGPVRTSAWQPPRTPGRSRASSGTCSPAAYIWPPASTRPASSPRPTPKRTSGGPSRRQASGSRIRWRRGPAARRRSRSRTRFSLLSQAFLKRTCAPRSWPRRSGICNGVSMPTTRGVARPTMMSLSGTTRTRWRSRR